MSRISHRTTGRLRRSTLVRLRWGAIIGQIIAIASVEWLLGYDFDFLPCVSIVALSVLVNIVVSVMWPLDRRAGDVEAVFQLGFDLLQLFALLWLTGGMANPFALLILAPVVTGATTLSRPVLLILGGLATGLSFTLLFTSAPLPWTPSGEFELPMMFLLGKWAALIVGTIFTSLYAWYAASESRRMSQALAATEAVLAHEQKLSALGGLAAAAAHELGTPLATIQVTAKEMALELPEDTVLGEDARLVLSQAKRCRDILQQLSRRGDEGDIIHDQLTLEDLLEEAAEAFFDYGPQIHIRVDGDGPPPEIGRRAELLYGLKNIIENAMDFAESRVNIFGRWDAKTVQIVIEDDGPGFDPSIVTRLGEPYVSRRTGTENAGGLGLGVFIAKTLIERTDGTVKFSQALPDVREGGGAKVTLSWRRDQLVIPV